MDDYINVKIKKTVLIISLIGMCVLAYLMHNMYAFAKGVINDIPIIKDDTIKTHKIISKIKIKEEVN